MNEKPPDSTDASQKTVQDVLKALAELTAAMKNNRTDSKAGQPGERQPSVPQLRTALNYQVLGQLTGRSGFKDLIVQVTRSTAEGKEFLTIHTVPDDAVKVSVHAVGDRAPQVIGFRKGRTADKTVELTAAVGKEIARVELLNEAGAPIRLGPRVPRLSGGDVIDSTGGT